MTLELTAGPTPGERDVSARADAGRGLGTVSDGGPGTGAGGDAAPDYVVTRKRMKHLRMRVSVPDGVVRVSAPFHAKQSDIHDFVVGRTGWIRKQQALAGDLPAPLAAGPEAERLRAEMRESVPPLMAYWAERMGLAMPTLSLRRMTSRWGTCNAVKRHVTLSLELGRRDPELLEYVIVHELAHLFEPNHSQRFYAVMDKYLPEWQEKRRQLNGR